MIESSIIYLEQNVLFSCIKDNKLILELDKDLFLSEEALSLYICFKNLFIEDLELSKRNLLIELEKHNFYIKESVIDSLYNLDIDYSEKSFKKYKQDLKKQKFKFEISNQILPELLKDSSKDSTSIEDIQNIVNRLQKSISEVELKKIKSFNPKSMYDNYISTLYERQNSFYNYSTGDERLDFLLLEKFAPGKITTIFAQSGVGKSAFALYLVNKQLHKMIPSMYFTLEMSYEASMDRLIAQNLNIPVKFLYPALHNEDDDAIEIPQYIFDQVGILKHRFRNSQFFEMVEDDSLYIRDIESYINNFKIKNKVDYAVVTIDLLTMIRNFNTGATKKADQYENAMNLLHEMARRTNVHIVGVVQGKRPSERMSINSIEQLDRFRPQIEELKNSSAIEERSRIILGLFRKKHFAKRYLPDDPLTNAMPDIAEVDILKHNMGSLGRIKYLFNPETYNFTYYQDDEDYDEDYENNEEYSMDIQDIEKFDDPDLDDDE